VFVLRTQHEPSHAEVAATMGITMKTVEIRTGRARTALRGALAG
jgi:DNA-directed RNA polymerase specialized sigma24 family protein